MRGRRRAPEEIEQAFWGLATADRESVLHSLESDERSEELESTLWGAGPADSEVHAATLRGLGRRYRARAELIEQSLPVGKVAELLGVTPQAVLDRLKQRDLVGLKHGKDWRLPIWQFEPDAERGVVPGIRRLRNVFPGGVVSLTLWATTANPEVDGRTPAEAMADGDADRVVRAASNLTAAAW